MSDGFVGFVGGVVIASICWFIYNLVKYTSKVCPKCNKKFNKEDVYCMTCGVKLWRTKVIIEPIK